MSQRRVLTDETTAEEMFAWHREDSPDCREPGVSWHTEGFGCRVCGWMVYDEEEA